MITAAWIALFAPAAAVVAIALAGTAISRRHLELDVDKLTTLRG